MGCISPLPLTTPSSQPDSALSLLLQHSTSVSIMGFSNTLEMELSSTRLARALEPQIQGVSNLTAGPPQAMPSLLSGPPTVPSLTGGQNQAMPSLTASHLQTVPSLVRGAPQPVPTLMGDSSQAITNLASDYPQAGPNLMSGPIQAVPSLATCPLQSMPPASDMQPETRSNCSPGSGRASGSLCPGDGADPSLGNALCKVSPGKTPFNCLCSSLSKSVGPEGLILPDVFDSCCPFTFERGKVRIPPVSSTLWDKAPQPLVWMFPRTWLSPQNWKSRLTSR